MKSEALRISLDPRSRRQLGEDGLIVLWRDAPEPGRREGLVCVLSICPHAKCACELVYVDGYWIDDGATEVVWGEDRIRTTWAAGASRLRTTEGESMIASVDPYSGEVVAHPDFADRTDPALVEWLSSEQDEDMLELLYRFLARAKGYPPQQPSKDLDLDELEARHLAAFDELFDGVRFDEYIVGGGRYWTSVYLCPAPGCDCHEARVVFFDDAADPEAGEAVGSMLLDLRGAEGFKVVSEDAESRAQEPLLRELWALFERRHRVGAYLRGREAQAQALGATLWVPAAKPVRVAPKPGRNDPCHCGSGLKYKKCCLEKDTSTRS